MIKRIHVVIFAMLAVHAMGGIERVCLRREIRTTSACLDLLGWNSTRAEIRNVVTDNVGTRMREGVAALVDNPIDRLVFKSLTAAWISTARNGDSSEPIKSQVAEFAARRSSAWMDSLLRETLEYNDARLVRRVKDVFAKAISNKEAALDILQQAQAQAFAKHRALATRTTEFYARFANLGLWLRGFRPRGSASAPIRNYAVRKLADEFNVMAQLLGKCPPAHVSARSADIKAWVHKVAASGLTDEQMWEVIRAGFETHFDPRRLQDALDANRSERDVITAAISEQAKSLEVFRRAAADPPTGTRRSVPYSLDSPGLPELYSPIAAI